MVFGAAFLGRADGWTFEGPAVFVFITLRGVVVWWSGCRCIYKMGKGAGIPARS